MSDDKHFKFLIPRIPEGEVYKAEEEAEIILLQWFIKSKKDLAVSMERLVVYYAEHQRQSQAIPFINWLVENAGDPEEKANYIFKQGQIMEQVNNWPAAVAFYRAGMALEPAQGDKWYFMNNNLGYCLSKIGDFTEGEYFCRAAIAINPGFPNGHKNLGISLEGQGKYKEAFESYVQAVKVNARDPRAFDHMQNLYENVPELIDQIPDIEILISQCGEAVKFGKDMTNDLEKYLDKRAGIE
jgi:tetratricopeptide (TPR) repeat protein